tara:strand:+ start:1556 stop:2062 length:507 start_codon:yes stop_codon:yes gene_type:complete
VKRSEKNDFVKQLKEDLNNSSSVVVSHYAGLSVVQTDELRKAMRSSGTKFKVTKNRLAKLALVDTKYENISDLFEGPTAIAYSNDTIAPSKISYEFEKKYENFKIIGGSFEGEKVNLEKIKFIASLPSVEEIRSKLVGLVMAPAQKIASLLKVPSSNLVGVLVSKSKE